MNIRRCRIVVIAALSCLAILSSAPARSQAGPTTTVDELLTGSNGSRWRAAYDLTILPDEVRVEVRVRLVAGPGVTSADLERAKQAWARIVARAWDRRVEAEISSGRRVPVRVRLLFDDRNPHHIVAVKLGRHRVHMRAWPLRPERDDVIAHEFGHLIGAFDEYQGGAMSREDGRADPRSLMGNARGDGLAEPRHFWHVLKNVRALVAQRTGRERKGAALDADWP